MAIAAPVLWGLGEKAVEALVGLVTGYILYKGGETVYNEMSKAEEEAATKPETGAVDEVCSTCEPPNSKCKDNVKEMQEKIKKLKHELSKYDPNEDARGGHVYVVGGQLKATVPGGHYQEIRDLQRGLKRTLKAYAKDKCYKSASPGDKITRFAAEINVAKWIEIPPGIAFIPL